MQNNMEAAALDLRAPSPRARAIAQATQGMTPDELDDYYSDLAAEEEARSVYGDAQ